MGAGAGRLVIEHHDGRPVLLGAGAVGPEVCLLSCRCRDRTGEPVSGRHAGRCAGAAALPAEASGCKATPMRPIRSVGVERAGGTPWRAAICLIRYSGRWTRCLLAGTQASRPGAARPPSATAGGIGAPVTVSQARQAYCDRMWRCTKKRAGSTSSCSLTSSPILSWNPSRPVLEAFQANIVIAAICFGRQAGAAPVRHTLVPG